MELKNKIKINKKIIKGINLNIKINYYKILK